jgi:hypothetical protein
MMRKKLALVFVLAALGSAEAGVIRTSAKLVKGAAKVGYLVGKKTCHVAKKVIW